jgi:hypothetical protein
LPFAALVLASAATLALPSAAYAQRHARPRVYGAVVIARPYYYYPGFYGWGYPYAWGVPYGWGYPPPYYWGWYDNTGSARLMVTPKTAAVYVDGYYAGVADDFDGTFQALRVVAGEHELAFYQDGYRTVRQKVLIRRGATLKLSLELAPLAPGETSERPEPPPSAASRAPRPMRRAGPPPPARSGEAPTAGGSAMAPSGEPASPGAQGTVSIRVQPDDAEVIIDGEPWSASAPGERLDVNLAEGPHRIEVRRDGYRPYSANLRIRAGETERLNVSLTREQP